MSYLLTMFVVSLIGAASLAGGIIWTNRDSQNSPYGIRSTVKNGIGWGAGFLTAFAAEFTILAYV